MVIKFKRFYMEILEMEYFYEHKRKRNSYVSTHSHPSYELLYYISGRGQSAYRGEILKFGPSSVILYKPNEPHDELHMEDSIIYNFRFMVPKSFVCNDETVFKDENKEIFNKIELILRELKEKKTDYSLLVSVYLTEILIALNRKVTPCTDDTDLFFYTKQFINGNFDQEIDFRKLADIAGYSYDRFRHLFKKSTGLSPNQYILQKRLNAAKQRLADTTLKISDIAVACGFSDFSQFSACFKKYIGVSPGKYRALHR